MQHHNDLYDPPARSRPTLPPMSPPPPFERASPYSAANAPGVVRVSPWIALGAIALGVVLWPLGARYTMDGMIWVVNTMLGLLQSPIRVSLPPWPWNLLLLPAPILFSKIEWRPPLQHVRGRWRAAPAGAWVVWLLFTVMDAATTFLGLTNPDSGASPIARWVAASLAASGILSAALTFLPEFLVRFGWRALRR